MSTLWIQSCNVSSTVSPGQTEWLFSNHTQTVQIKFGSMDATDFTNWALNIETSGSTLTWPGLYYMYRWQSLHQVIHAHVNLSTCRYIYHNVHVYIHWWPRAGCSVLNVERVLQSAQGLTRSRWTRYLTYFVWVHVAWYSCMWSQSLLVCCWPTWLTSLCSSRVIDMCGPCGSVSKNACIYVSSPMPR